MEPEPQQPFNNLFDGFPDDGQDVSGEYPASVTGTAEEINSPAAPAPVPAPYREAGKSSVAAELIRDVSSLRLRVTRTQTEMLEEIRTLRLENNDLREENDRWKTLVDEYKQILSSR